VEARVKEAVTAILAPAAEAAPVVEPAAEAAAPKAPRARKAAVKPAPEPAAEPVTAVTLSKGNFSGGFMSYIAPGRPGLYVSKGMFADGVFPETLTVSGATFSAPKVKK
jgi:hypothetical protein